ncbi:MAG: hypothetical protein ACE5GV_11660 [Candidatus Scalindua sp.]
MDKHSGRKRRYSKRSKRMGWKSRRNKELKIYLTIFLICVFVAGAITFITGKVPTFIKKTVEKQIASRAKEVLGEKLKDMEGLKDMKGMDSKKIDELKKKYGGMIDKYRK